MKHNDLSIIAICISALCTGCIRTQTVLVQPGQPIRLLTPINAPAKSTATEVAQNQWIVNDTAVTLPAGAYVVVISAPSTQPTK